MNEQPKYSQYALVREMLETPAILRKFKPRDTADTARIIKETGRLFFTGEGSSRIFPAKNAMSQALRCGLDLQMATEGGRQALEYRLQDWVVFGASNSGQTKEVITLFDALKNSGHRKLFGLTANKNTKLESIATKTYLLSCGKENAVAATKSVAEQALFYQMLLAQVHGHASTAALSALGDAYEAALKMEVEPQMTDAIASAGTIYFAGRNDGVAEELTLKTNEITRRKSDYLEGTYAVHGIEEVMNPDDVVVLINPFAAEMEKIRETLVKGVGLRVFAIAAEETIFPTMKVRDAGEFSAYVYLAAGWNILIEVGTALGINLDKPVRARKVGNEFVG
jgi:glucosamine--fructose-6-phosphate aminotransferase (isomerizing)